MADRPFCRYCGKPIAKKTSTVYFEKVLKPEYHKPTAFTRHVEGQPTTKAEAQRLVDQEIVSVKRNGPVLYSCTTWDGESYVDPYFCTGDHAKRFAYAVAKQSGLACPAYWEAMNLPTRNNIVG